MKRFNLQKQIKKINLNNKKIKGLLSASLLLYMAFALVGAVLLHAKPQFSTYHLDNQWKQFHEEDKGYIGLESVYLVEDSYEAFKIRLDLIERAETTLDIAYYTIHPGMASDVFFGAVLDAADRGVEVRLLLDGVFHNLSGKHRSSKYALASHPQIELSFYEPFHFFKPWSWNNRLHDKYIIVDDHIVLTGGRNIGDKYFRREHTKYYVYDRDILIYTPYDQRACSRGLKDVVTYYDHLWESPYRVSYNVSDTRRRKQQASAEKIRLQEAYASVTEIAPYWSYESGFWHDELIETESVRLIHNSVERGNKKPWVLQYMAKEVAKTENSWVIQSPYVIPSRGMRNILGDEAIDFSQGKILKNSKFSSPNVFTMAGYSKYRSDFKSEIPLYEYYGSGTIHAKTLVVDQKTSFIGAFNLDARSTFLSTESMVVVESEHFARHVLEAIDSISEDAYALKKEPPYSASLLKHLIIAILYLPLYFLDFLL